jgi:hypothetical protein
MKTMILDAIHDGFIMMMLRLKNGEQGYSGGQAKRVAGNGPDCRRAMRTSPLQTASTRVAASTSVAKIDECSSPQNSVSGKEIHQTDISSKLYEKSIKTP